MKKAILFLFSVSCLLAGASLQARTPRALRQYMRDSLSTVAQRCQKVLNAAYMEGTLLEERRDVPGYEGYPVKLYEYWTGKDIKLGKQKKGLVLLLDPSPEKLAKWIINAVWDVRGEVRYADVERVRKFILYQSGAQFPVKGVVYEAMYTPGFYEPYVFKDGVTVYVKDGPMKAEDKTCTEEQLQFYISMENSDLKENTGTYARICSTTRSMYYAAGGTDEVGRDEAGFKSQAWLDTVRRLYLQAWDSDRNFLIYAWAKANLDTPVE
ncbi:MAG: cellulase [Bacteroidia bacterium]|nr:cellulase [Bacteroidia bacterium]